VVADADAGQVHDGVDPLQRCRVELARPRVPQHLADAGRAGAVVAGSGAGTSAGTCAVGRCGAAANQPPYGVPAREEVRHQRGADEAV
jgi:hypothetical protein